jgi:endonuclease/exonuclease/phosphatase family metal-dependent hydrolase
MRSKQPSDTAQILFFAILCLFFLQVLTDFIQSIYAFGLLVTAFTIQLAAILLLFSPLVLLFVRRRPARPWLVGILCVAILGRLLEPLLDPGGRLVACGISVGAFMLLFPLMLAGRAADAPPKPYSGWIAASGLLLAVSVSIFLRAAGSGIDLSESGIGQLVRWVLAFVAGWLIWGWSRLEVLPPGGDERQIPEEPARDLREAPAYEQRREDSLRALRESFTRAPPPAGPSVVSLTRSGLSVSTPHVLGLCIGLASVIVMIYFGFASPTVMARWTSFSYAAIVAVLVITLTIFSFLFSARGPVRFPDHRVMLIWNGLFVLMLVLTILPHQVRFPAHPAGYPFDAPAASPLGMAALFLMLILSPVIFIDFMLYIQGLSAGQPSVRQLGGGFALGVFVLLVLVFLHVFTTIYDYAQPIGPLLRDRFWLVYLLAGLGLALPVFLVCPWRREDAPALGSHTPVAQIVSALALLSIGAVYLTEPHAAQVPTVSPLLRVMTFNIQQGFDKVGNADLPGQLGAIERVGPDILGIEESDTARIANGNVDAVRYFADHLGMYSYYGPSTTVGTFGIALLSKYPIQNPRTFYMYSTGEQTAAIQAQIQFGGTNYNVFVTHLGNDGPMIQLQNLLQRVNGLPNVILVGDFNFTPLTPQYKLATESLADAWALRWPSGRQIAGLEDRIDLIMVSSGTQVLQAEYVPNPDSDHPYVFVVMQPKSLAQRPLGTYLH